MAKTHVTATINGDETEFLTEESTSLLNALRDDVGLMGVKEGCATGDCGACSIIMNDELNASCLVFAPEASGATIVTVEGMSDGDHLHPLQQCFLEGAALQCGICTPGFLVAAKVLLDKNPNPTETEIRYALAGNLCRCTGYDKIIRAVQEAASRMQEA
ncbi:MAG: carbon-monoxide dehydrogenase small subunit [Acidimicrobiales bacterium]|jgi:aerobic carbon-monoxide dehydrogenase small subunit